MKNTSGLKDENIKIRRDILPKSQVPTLYPHDVRKEPLFSRFHILSEQNADVHLLHLQARFFWIIVLK